MRDLNNIKIDSRRLKWLLKESKTTQLELASQLGMNKDYLNQRIREGYMNEFTLNKICQHFDVSPNYVKGEDSLTVERVMQLFSNDSDKLMRSQLLRRVDDDNYIVLSYDAYAYNENNRDIEERISDFLRSLIFTTQYLYDDEFISCVEEIKESSIDLFTLRVKQSIKNIAKEVLFDFDPDTPVAIEIYLKERNENLVNYYKKVHSNDKEDIQKK